MLSVCTVSTATKTLLVRLISAQQKTWQDQKRKHSTVLASKEKLIKTDLLQSLMFC